MEDKFIQQRLNELLKPDLFEFKEVPINTPISICFTISTLIDNVECKISDKELIIKVLEPTSSKEFKSIVKVEYIRFLLSRSELLAKLLTNDLSIETKIKEIPSKKFKIDLWKEV